VKIFRDQADQGATAVLVALSLLVLLGFAALAMDGGRAYNERRSTQNAADNAALAAAWASCTDSDPEQAAIDSANANGGYGTSLTLTEIQGGVFQASITTDQDTTFARAIGFNQVTVISEAEADCEKSQFAGGFALFAGAESCGPNELSMNASSAIPLKFPPPSDADPPPWNECGGTRWPGRALLFGDVAVSEGRPSSSSPS
jgi:hypothetical protein